MLRKKFNYYIAIFLFTMLIVLTVMILNIAMVYSGNEDFVLQAASIVVLSLCLLIAVISLVCGIKKLNQWKVGLLKERLKHDILDNQSQLDKEVVEVIGNILEKQKEFLENVKELLCSENEESIEGRENEENEEDEESIESEEPRQRMLRKVSKSSKEYDNVLKKLQCLMVRQNKIVEDFEFLKDTFRCQNLRFKYIEDITSAQNALVNTFCSVSDEQKHFISYLKSFDVSIFPKNMTSIVDMFNKTLNLLKVSRALKEDDGPIEFREFCKREYNFEFDRALQSESCLKNELQSLLINDSSLQNRMQRLESNIGELDMFIKDFMKQDRLLLEKIKELDDTFSEMTCGTNHSLKERYNTERYKLEQQDVEYIRVQCNDRLSRLFSLLASKLGQDQTVQIHDSDGIRKRSMHCVTQLMSASSKRQSFNDLVNSLVLLEGSSTSTSVLFQRDDKIRNHALKLMIANDEKVENDTRYNTSLYRNARRLVDVSSFREEEIKRGMLSDEDVDKLSNRMKEDVMDMLYSIKSDISNSLALCNKNQDYTTLLMRRRLDCLLDSVDSLIKRLENLRCQFEETAYLCNDFKRDALLFMNDGVCRLPDSCDTNQTSKEEFKIDHGRLYKISDNSEEELCEPILSFDKLEGIVSTVTGIDEEFTQIEKRVTDLLELDDFSKIKKSVFHNVRNLEPQTKMLFDHYRVMSEMNLLFCEVAGKIDINVSPDRKEKICCILDNIKGRLLQDTDTIAVTPLREQKERLMSFLTQLENAEMVTEVQQLLNNFLNSSKEIILLKILDKFRENRAKILSTNTSDVKSAINKFVDKLKDLQEACKDRSDVNTSQQILQIFNKIDNKVEILKELKAEDDEGKVIELRSLLTQLSTLFVEESNVQEKGMIDELVTLFDELLLKKKEGLDYIESESQLELKIEQLLQKMMHFGSFQEDQSKDETLSSISELENVITCPVILQDLCELKDVISQIYSISNDLDKEQRTEMLNYKVNIETQKLKLLLTNDLRRVEELKLVQNIQELQMQVEDRIGIEVQRLKKLVDDQIQSEIAALKSFGECDIVKIQEVENSSTYRFNVKVEEFKKSLVNEFDQRVSELNKLIQHKYNVSIEKLKESSKCDLDVQVEETLTKEQLDIKVERLRELLGELPNIGKSIENVGDTEQLKTLITKTMQEVKEKINPMKDDLISKVRDVISDIERLHTYLTGFVTEQPMLKQELKKVSYLKNNLLKFEEILNQEDVDLQSQLDLNNIFLTFEEIPQESGVILPSVLSSDGVFSTINLQLSDVCYFNMFYNTLILSYYVQKRINTLRANGVVLEDDVESCKKKLRTALRVELGSLISEIMYYPRDLEKIEKIREMLTDHGLIENSTELDRLLDKVSNVISLKAKYVEDLISVKKLDSEVSRIREDVGVKYDEKERLEGELKQYRLIKEGTFISSGTLTEYMEEVNCPIPVRNNVPAVVEYVRPTNPTFSSFGIR